MPRTPRLSPVILVALFLPLTVLTWVFINPPGYTPDESAHYIKAFGVGRGQWVGRPGEYPVGPGFGPAQLEWINRAARIVEVPPRLAPDGMHCAVFRPDLTPDCADDVVPLDLPERLTYVGTYEPFLYVPPGLAIRAASSATEGVYLARFTMAALCGALLCLAVACLWRRGRPASLVGLLLAATPTCLFLTSGLSPVGTELAGALALGAAVIRLARGTPRDRLGWTTAALAGTLVALSRSFGPFLVVSYAAAFVLIAGPHRARRTVGDAGWIGRGALAAVALGITANLAWGIAAQPSPPFSLQAAVNDLWPSVTELPTVYRQAVAVFGWQDVRAPVIVPWAWGLLLVGSLTLALSVGDRRQRLVVVLLTAGAAVGTVAIAVGAIHRTSFPMFGRYALPVSMLAPLYAGEVITARWSRLPAVVRRTLVPPVTVTVALAHGVSFYANSHRYAVGLHGPQWFMGQSRWHPIGGWEPWFALGALALVLLVLAGLVGREDAVEKSDNQALQIDRRSAGELAPSGQTPVR